MRRAFQAKLNQSPRSCRCSRPSGHSGQSGQLQRRPAVCEIERFGSAHAQRLLVAWIAHPASGWVGQRRFWAVHFVEIQARSKKAAVTSMLAIEPKGDPDVERRSRRVALKDQRLSQMLVTSLPAERAPAVLQSDMVSGPPSMRSSTLRRCLSLLCAWARR